MGLLKAIFGGLFRLIGGIFGSVAKVFGLGNKSEYFMELDGSEQPAEQMPQMAASKPAEKKPINEKPVVDTAAPVKVSEAKSSQPQQDKASYKEQIPVTTQMATSDSSGSVDTKMPAVSNFATDYLVNPRVNRSPRRRPGPSMSPFKDMARDMGRKSASMG